MNLKKVLETKKEEGVNMRGGYRGIFRITALFVLLCFVLTSSNVNLALASKESSRDNEARMYTLAGNVATVGLTLLGAPKTFSFAAALVEPALQYGIYAGMRGMGGDLSNPHVAAIGSSLLSTAIMMPFTFNTGEIDGKPFSAKPFSTNWSELKKAFIKDSAIDWKNVFGIKAGGQFFSYDKLKTDGGATFGNLLIPRDAIKSMLGKVAVRELGKVAIVSGIQEVSRHQTENMHKDTGSDSINLQRELAWSSVGNIAAIAAGGFFEGVMDHAYGWGNGIKTFDSKAKAEEYAKKNGGNIPVELKISDKESHWGVSTPFKENSSWFSAGLQGISKYGKAMLGQALFAGTYFAMASSIKNSTGAFYRSDYHSADLANPVFAMAVSELIAAPLTEYIALKAEKIELARNSSKTGSAGGNTDEARTAYQNWKDGKYKLDNKEKLKLLETIGTSALAAGISYYTQLAVYNDKREVGLRIDPMAFNALFWTASAGISALRDSIMQAVAIKKGKELVMSAVYNYTDKDVAEKKGYDGPDNRTNKNVENAAGTLTRRVYYGWEPKTDEKGNVLKPWQVFGQSYLQYARNTMGDILTLGAGYSAAATGTYRTPMYILQKNTLVSDIYNKGFNTAVLYSYLGSKMHYNAIGQLVDIPVMKGFSEEKGFNSAEPKKEEETKFVDKKAEDPKKEECPPKPCGVLGQQSHNNRTLSHLMSKLGIKGWGNQDSKIDKGSYISMEPEYDEKGNVVRWHARVIRPGESREYFHQPRGTGIYEVPEGTDPDKAAADMEKKANENPGQYRDEQRKTEGMEDFGNQNASANYDNNTDLQRYYQMMLPPVG